MKASAPTNLAPNGGVLDTRQPTLSFSHAAAKFANVAFSHQLEVQDANGGVVYGATVAESSSTHAVDVELPFSQTFWWRARGVRDGQVGPWSNFATFTTPDPPPPVVGPGTGSGSGPRTADPPPGQLLPVPDYGLSVVMDVAFRYSNELRHACKDNHDWLFLLVQELRKYDTRWGLNWKRGDPGQGMSTDIVSYNPTDQPDNGNGQVYIFDVIGAECEANAPGFSNATGATWPNRGNSLCGPGTWCTMWTLDPYIAAGFKP